MKTSGIVLALVLFISASGSAQHLLEYKSTGGASLHYKAHTQLGTTQSMMGQETKAQFSSDQSLTVSSSQSGEDLVYRITVDSSDNVTILSTGDTTHSPSPAVGQTKETHIRPDGEEISSRWLDTTFAGTQAGQMRDLGNFFFKLPTAPVNSGSAWNQKKDDTVSTPGGQGKILVHTDTDYKLEGDESVDGVTCAKISYTGKVTLKGSASIQGMDLAIDGGGTITGTAYFDYTNGRVTKMDGVSNQNIVMATSGDNAMTIPMTQSTNYSLFLSK